MVFTIALTGYSLFTTANYAVDFNSFSPITFYEAATSLVMLVAIGYTVFTRSRLAAVASMGIIGYAICILFVIYSAPDLAMTQFSIDTLTVILFVLVLYKLPKYLKLSDYKMRIRDGVLSLAFGTIITLLILEVLAEPVNKEVSDYYAANAYILAHGKNVVNVILVDFRGSDTLLEISVLAIAAIGVFALLKLRLKKSDQR
jgi:multicomponent Na+:H+ antiporter subunit A